MPAVLTGAIMCMLAAQPSAATAEPTFTVTHSTCLDGESKVLHRPGAESVVLCGPPEVVPHAHAEPQDPLSMMGWLVLCPLLFALCALRLGAHQSASHGTATSLPAVQIIARRVRTAAALGVIAWLGAICSEPHVLLAVWPIPLLLGSTAARAHATLSGQHATRNGNYVHIWRDGRLYAWLYVRSRKIDALAVPPARARVGIHSRRAAPPKGGAVRSIRR